MSHELKCARAKQAQHPSDRHFRSGSTPDKRLRGVGLVAALTVSLSAPAFAADSVQINDLVIAAPMPDAQREATMKAIRAFSDFWNTGDEALLKQVITPNFTDHTLPPGRPQGPEAPPLPRAASIRRDQPESHGREDDRRRRLRHRAYELHRPFHREARAGRGARASRSLSSPPTSSRSRTVASQTIGTSTTI